MLNFTKICVAQEEVDKQGEEARNEIGRIASEKKFGPLTKFLFRLCAFSNATDCANAYIGVIAIGKHWPVCICGYHPSRRKIRTIITEETAARDLKNIADRFCVTGQDNETRRSADILLQVLETVRNELKQPKFLRMRYLDSEVRSEKLPK